MSQDDEFVCPSSTDKTCDKDRCPLQGPSIAPIKEPVLAGLILHKRINCLQLAIKHTCPLILSFNLSHCVSRKFSQFLRCINQLILYHAPGQLIVGGFDGDVVGHGILADIMCGTHVECDKACA